MLSGLVLIFTETEKNMISVERVAAFVDGLPEEEEEEEEDEERQEEEEEGDDGRKRTEVDEAFDGFLID